MKWRWFSALPVFSLLLISGNSMAQQKCPQCDCNHIPIEKKCEDCCGIASGEITSVTNSKVELSERLSTSESVAVKKTFALTPGTKRNAALKEGAQATVYYHRDGNVATKVDLVERLSGLLIPSNKPDPPLPNSCGPDPVPVDALRVYAGSNVGISTSREITVLSVKGVDLIDLRRTPNGIAISARTFGEDGKIVAQIVDNQFYVNPSNFFRLDRPNNHSLSVYDVRGTKVVDITYINPHSVVILGVFRVPDAPPVVVNENEIVLGGFRFTEGCFVNVRTMFKY